MRERLHLLARAPLPLGVGARALYSRLPRRRHDVMAARAEFAIIGAGIGGLALAGLLSRQGARVRLYEQAKQFQRIGAGIQMSSNAMRVLRALGLEQHLRARAFEPPAWTHRVWNTGEHL